MVATESKVKLVEMEPLFLKQQHPNNLVIVDENRNKNAIERIMKNHPEIEIIIMDDGFQHRNVKAGLSSTITHYHLPYYKDDLLPMGTLRESKKSSERADIIMVSKAPKRFGSY